jgi:hypothetical protein
MKNRSIQSYLLAILFVFFVVGCFPLKNQKGEEGSNHEGFFAKLLQKIPVSSTSSILTSPDGRSQITLPPGWQEDRALHEKADLTASNRREEMYIIVLSEDKSDFQQMNLEKHSETTRASLLQNATSPQTSEPKRFTINGHPALQYEIRAGIDNVNVVYLHTTVETPKNFHQIVAWSLKSRFEKNLPTLEQVIESFKEIPKR